jgi:hypothetical protein
VISDSSNLTHTWQWQEWQGLPYLTCSLLQDWKHGFFTQQFSPQTPEALVAILHPQAEVYRVKQVHGATVLTPSEIEIAKNQAEETNSLASADGIVTLAPQQAVWVATADCTPVLIADTHTGRVAAVHAGWRGTAKRIVPEAIERLLSSGVSLENLRVAMGPAISGEVYQVTEHTAVEIGASIIPSELADTPEAILAALWEIPNSPISKDSHPGRVRLDVRRVNQIQLEQLGISLEQMAIAPHCTYQQPELFFSYRRSQLKKVQWSGIVSQF